MEIINPSLLMGVLGGLFGAVVGVLAWRVGHWADTRRRQLEVDTLATELDALRETFKRFQSREGMRATRDAQAAAKSAQSEAQAILADVSKTPSKPKGARLPFPFNRGVGH